jgi:hypothetical protein
MIAGHAFLYQTVNGIVYHVSRTVKEIKSWSSDEPIVAFVDADSRTSMPASFLRRHFADYCGIVTRRHRTKLAETRR